MDILLNLFSLNMFVPLNLSSNLYTTKYECVSIAMLVSSFSWCRNMHHTVCFIKPYIREVSVRMEKFLYLKVVNSCNAYYVYIPIFALQQSMARTISSQFFPTEHEYITMHGLLVSLKNLFVRIEHDYITCMTW